MIQMRRLSRAFADLDGITGRLEMGSKELPMTDKAQRLAALCQQLQAIPHPPGTGPVCGEGYPEAALVLVGEAPGETEVKQRRPFVGRAGRLLDRALADVGLTRADLWITNLVKFRPVVATHGRLWNRAPTAREVRTWLPALQQELQIIAPRAILCLGAIPARALIDSKFALTRERGGWRPGPGGAAIAATYHPAYLLRLEGNAHARALAEFRADLAAARQASVDCGGLTPLWTPAA